MIRGKEYLVKSASPLLSAATIVTPNKASGVAVVHVVDEVLLPASAKPLAPSAPPSQGNRIPPPARPPPPPRAPRIGGAVAGPSYLGCYTDGTVVSGSTIRGLPTALSYTGTLTKLSCASAANAAGLAFFGMQNGNLCFGGNNLVVAQAQGVSSNCNVACTGDSSQICGGAGANAVWSTSGRPAAPASTCSDSSCWTYVGCFTEPSCTTGARLGMDAVLTPKAICFGKNPFTGKPLCLAVPTVMSQATCADLAKASSAATPAPGLLHVPSSTRRLVAGSQLQVLCSPEHWWCGPQVLWRQLNCLCHQGRLDLLLWLLPQLLRKPGLRSRPGSHRRRSGPCAAGAPHCPDLVRLLAVLPHGLGRNGRPGRSLPGPVVKGCGHW